MTEIVIAFGARSGEKMVQNKAQAIFWGDGNTVCLDYGDCFMGLYNRTHHIV